jgi:medium-chain acyl-[acyl-carrier-protein] hydrolase
MRKREKGIHSGIQYNRWFYVPCPKTDPALRLFCFPFAGGTAEIFHQWPEGLPRDVEMCAVQPPGRSTRLKEPPLTRISIIVEQLAQAMFPFLDKPFAFFGHSMGAMVLFDLAHHLKQNGGKLPVHIFVSGRRAPQVPSLHPHIHHLTNEECISIMRGYNAVPEEILENSQLMKLLMPVIKADFEAVEKWTYEEKPSLEIPIWAFAAVNDNLASRENMEVWNLHTCKAFKLFTFPGQHFFIQDPPSQKAILQLVSTALDYWTGETN